jgi:hypothetical protein
MSSKIKLAGVNIGKQSSVKRNASQAKLTDMMSGGIPVKKSLVTRIQGK